MRIENKNASKRTQEKIHLEQSKKITTKEAIGITIKRFKKDGNISAAKILPDLLDPKKADKIAMLLAKPEPQKMSAEDTVGLCIDNGITSHEYKRMRNKSRALGHDQYPSKHQVTFIYISLLV